jgi:DNA-binding response OmpR family regulator
VKILIVEDDASLLQVISEWFRSEGFETDTAASGDDGFFLAETGIYDLIILDLMLPGMDGLEVLRQLRRKGVSAPVILLTARDSVRDRVAGLDAGADDYVTKPFAASELLARARAVLRRNGTVDAGGEMIYGVIRLQPGSREAYAGEQLLKLTGKEYELLEFFLGNKEQIVTREQIFDRIWGFNSGSASSAVDVYVHHLRKKLSQADCGHYLQTVRGIGYIFKGEDNV